MRIDPPTFDRASLTAAASLNELVITVGPYVGCEAIDLLSRDAVAGLAPQLEPTRLSDELASRPSLMAPVAKEVGKRVAALISALRRGECALSAERESVERTRALAEWQIIDDVVLGGGLLAGPMGPAVLKATQESLDGAPATDVSVSPHPAWLGLIGVARSSAEGDHLVIDGGQSSIKTGIAEVNRGELVRLRLLPPVPFAPDDDITAVLSHVITTHSEWVSAEAVPCSVAAYVRDGRPIRFCDNAYEKLADGAQSVLGKLALVHDGTAAWRGTGRDSSSAVIMLGTFLGVGMGPQRTIERLHPLSPDFEVVAAGPEPTIS